MLCEKKHNLKIYVDNLFLELKSFNNEDSFVSYYILNLIKENICLKKKMIHFIQQHDV